MTDRKKYGDTVKIFISQPMTGKSPEEIRKTRENIIKHAGMKYGGDIIILDSWFGEEFGKKSPLYLLGKSLELLAEADIAIFGSGWEQSRGCRIEHTCCEEYSIPMEYAK